MNLGLSSIIFVHVGISVVAMGTGFVVLGGMLASARLERTTTAFLITSGLTSATGFLFPIHGFTPALGVGVVSLLVLGLACAAKYGRRMAGRWRATYVLSAVTLLYLNVFVLVAQLFQKVPALHDLAPKQSEPPFAGAQLGLLILFVVAAISAVARFRDTAAADRLAPAAASPSAWEAVSGPHAQND